MARRPEVVRVFDSLIPSGNGYKVHLTLAELGLRAEVIDLDVLADPSETRTSEFLTKNPNGRIPVAELADGTFLPESNAIVLYLAEGTHLMPVDPVVRARMHAWMFFEQYSHERFIAVLKFWTYWGGQQNCRAEDIATWRVQGQAALEVMGEHLTHHSFFSGDQYGPADISLFAYTQSAEAVGYDLSALPQVRAWLARVRAQPRYVPIKDDPLGRAPRQRA